MNHEVPNDKNVAALLSEMKEQLKEFAQTRFAMLKAELQEKVRVAKASAPLAVIGILLLSTAYLLLTIALVGLIAAAFPHNPFRWAIAFGLIGVLWAILGAGAAYAAIRAIMSKGLAPRRTVEVLKADKLWFQSEVKNQI